VTLKTNLEKRIMNKSTSSYVTYKIISDESTNYHDPHYTISQIPDPKRNQNSFNIFGHTAYRLTLRSSFVFILNIAQKMQGILRL
jgi:hypothetical protein